MTLANQNFTMIAGDTKNIVVTDVQGTNLSGSTIRWILKKGSTILTKTTSSGITISGTTFTIRLNSSDTANLTGPYYHEARITDVAGNVSTAMKGCITFESSNV